MDNETQFSFYYFYAANTKHVTCFYKLAARFERSISFYLPSKMSNEKIESAIKMLIDKRARLTKKQIKFLRDRVTHNKVNL